MKTTVSRWTCILLFLMAAGAAPSRGQGGTRQDEPPGGTRTHLVKARETLGEISQQYYGSTQHWRRIAEANGITDPRRVREGMTLVIPPLTGPLPPRPPSGDAGDAGPRGTRGDTSAGPASGPAGEAPRGPLARIRDNLNRVLGGHAIWWSVLGVPLAFLPNLLVFWVASNIVHTQRMNLGRAALCAGLTLLVDVGCFALAALLWSAVAESTGQEPTAWPVAGLGAVWLLGLLAGLMVIKFVYRDTVGKTLALWVVSGLLALACCFVPAGALLAWLPAMVAG